MTDHPMGMGFDALMKQGQQLASQRDDLIVEGVNPNELEVPIAPRRREKKMVTKKEVDDAYAELRAIPWWHFREQNEAARKFNRLQSTYSSEIWNRPKMLQTYKLVFMDGTEKDVMGYDSRVSDAGILKIRTSDRRGGPESYEWYPTANLKSWTV